MNDWDRLLDLARYQSGSAQDLFTNRFDELNACRRGEDAGVVLVAVEGHLFAAAAAVDGDRFVVLRA